MAACPSPQGFIGVGIMGLGMADNLLKNGVPLIIWNRTASACEPLLSSYPELCRRVDSPEEVVAACAVTWSMLSTLEASDAVFPAVLSAITPGKSIVDCATFTPERMQQMDGAVTAKGGRFLEAPVSGSKGPAAAGQVTHNAAVSLVPTSVCFRARCGHNLASGARDATPSRVVCFQTLSFNRWRKKTHVLLPSARGASLSSSAAATKSSSANSPPSLATWERPRSTSARRARGLG